MARYVAYSLSLICACVAVWLFLQYRAIADSHVWAVAEAINIDRQFTEGVGGTVRRSYHMIVNIPLEDGTHEMVVLKEELPSLRLPAKQVEVFYPAGQPELARTRSGLAALWPTLLAAGMALATFAAGVIFHFEDKRRKPLAADTSAGRGEGAS